MESKHSHKTSSIIKPGITRYEINRHENETCDHWLDQLIIVSLSEAVRIPKQEAMRSPKAPLRWILQTKALNQRQTSLATPRYKNENSFQILSSKDNTL